MAYSVVKEDKHNSQVALLCRCIERLAASVSHACRVTMKNELDTSLAAPKGGLHQSSAKQAWREDCCVQEHSQHSGVISTCGERESAIAVSIIIQVRICSTLDQKACVLHSIPVFRAN